MKVLSFLPCSSQESSRYILAETSLREAGLGALPLKPVSGGDAYHLFNQSGRASACDRPASGSIRFR